MYWSPPSLVTIGVSRTLAVYDSGDCFLDDVTIDDVSGDDAAESDKPL